MNFKIITVNGKDLSDASHEEAAKAFECAEEPITVVVTRSNSGGGDVPPCTPSGKCDASTQTSEESCHCKCEMQDGQKSFITSSSKSNSDKLLDDLNDDSLKQEDFVYEDEYHIRFEKEEVTLHRSDGNSKLGITLCDSIDKLTGEKKLTVTQVTPETVASLSRKIFEGDVILKIDNIPVCDMTQAAQMLNNTKSTSVKFLIGRSHLLHDDDSHYADEQELLSDLHADDVLCDVIEPKYDQSFVASGTHYLPVRETRQNRLEHVKSTSKKMIRNSGGTTESTTSTNSQSAKDSGFGHTLERIEQDLETEVKALVDSPPFESTFVCKQRCTHSKESKSFDDKEQHLKKCFLVASHPSRSRDCTSSTKPANKVSISDSNNNELDHLSEALCDLDLSKQRNNCYCSRLSMIEEYDDGLGDITSPWVRIARQDYQDKLRQLHTQDVRNIHPAMVSNNAVTQKSSSSNDAADNTSSAYSTGESLRSSNSENSRLNCSRSDDNARRCKPRQNGVTITYYTSSDANSDCEGPACYLTHNDSDSEGFEDAGVEFSSLFTSEPTPKPVPLPRRLYPPQDISFIVANSLTASTKNLWKATAAIARKRRSNSNRADSGATVSHKPSNSEETAAHIQNSSQETEATNSPEAHNEPQFSTAPSDNAIAPEDITNIVPKVRRFSDYARPGKTHPKTRRSLSNVENSNVPKTDHSDDVQMEWKVRVSRDGTRYITKRPVRERLLRQREKRLCAERCGLTTDDDFTEMKLGRHWSREERKRHLRHAREKKRRREFMQKSRLEEQREKTPADGDIVELSRKKMCRQKQKRMLLDSFVTVQEIVAHGNRTNDVTKINPLLSVTYI